MNPPTSVTVIVFLLIGVIAAVSLEGVPPRSDSSPGYHRSTFLDRVTRQEHPREHRRSRPHRPRCNGGRRGRCPSQCSKDLCRTDCPTGMCCCNKGCVYTCIDTVIPPPVLDWVTEPVRQKNSGWLVHGPKEAPSVETCSTTMFDDDFADLSCPTGYECHIQDNGDPLHDIPNRGICVQETPSVTTKVMEWRRN
ncbi:WAP four-disulfide core domain protein 1-like [Saccoglossus kowalevskii]